MNLLEYLKQHKDDVLFCDRKNNIITIFCKGNVEIVFKYNTTETAIKKYTLFRKELEDIYLGDEK